MSKKRLFAAACLVCLSMSAVFAATIPEWRSWRGPHDSGSIEQGNYPVKFGAEQYLWRTELPGKGCSTPILSGGLIYVTSAAEGNDALLCIDMQGKEKWRTVFGQEDPGKH